MKHFPRIAIRPTPSRILFLALILIALAFPGCAGFGHVAVSPGAVSDAPPKAPAAPAAEAAAAPVEQAPIRVDPTPLFMEEYSTLCNSALARHDYELAITAALVLVRIAPEHQRDLGWRFLAEIVRQAPDGLAIALAETGPSLCKAFERTRGTGLDAVTIRDATHQRANQAYLSASADYSRAQGFWNDDEDLIMYAFASALESQRLWNAFGMDMGTRLTLDSLLGDCEGDLWSSQASRVRRSHEAAVQTGQQSVSSAYSRYIQVLDGIQTMVLSGEYPGTDWPASWSEAGR